MKTPPTPLPVTRVPISRVPISRVPSSLVTVALAGVLALGGCSAAEPDRTSDGVGGTAPANAGGRGDQATTVTTATTTVVTTDALPEPPALEGAEGAVADVSFDECATGPGEVTVAGTVTNSTEATADYVITLTWVTTASSDIVTRAVATVENLAAGETSAWTVSASVPESGEMACAVEAERGSLTGPGRASGPSG